MSRCVHPTSLLITFFFFLHIAFSQTPPSQISSMKNLYELLQNITSLPWNPTINPNPCSWNGVNCTNSSITQLTLSSLSLSNSNSLPIICQIDTLQSLDVSNNHFTSIPHEFFTLCGRIATLKSLNFSRNKIVGSLPNFPGFDSLEVLDFSWNQFNGPIPTNLGTSMALKELQLSMNFFHGNIPQEIGNYGNLTLIDFGVNKLSGSIAEQFGELSKLEFLILSMNDLSGGIPNSLSRITTLSRFAANQNNFSGVIPPEITTYLRNLDLSYCW